MPLSDTATFSRLFPFRAISNLSCRSGPGDSSSACFAFVIKLSSIYSTLRLSTVTAGTSA